LRMALRANLLLLLACLTAPILAQEPQITSNMEVDSSLLQKWLHSGDPRLIAWSADFARRRHDSQIISEIPGVLEHLSMPPVAGGHEEQAPRRRAALALVDTLIQENAQVALPVIELVARMFPAQSILLIQRVPLESSKETLINWAFNRDGINQTAAMILAKTPDPAFVYRILEGLELNVTVHILPLNSFWGSFGGGPGCPGGLHLPPPPGWPQIYDYDLRDEYGEAGKQDSNSTPVVELGSHRVLAVRFEENRGRSRCSFGGSNDTFRHELIAYWLGIAPKDMPWQPYQSLTIGWTSKTAYEKQIDSVVQSDRAVVSDTLLQLRHRGLLNEQMPNRTFPPITIGIVCEIHPCPLQGSLVFER